ncbi:ras GTPase-activating-like protein Iqg1p [[Candida] jaroonii]|uniref:Ras GTPase-activating-like protein Iqg1p n=1 Tax=[Candida] jaroonii TaxID=467808 RepID=A0ACA9Y7J4_9ASCO|nr:ras GTPase-activating-like protein Iqg1p [[Candida] jaroonii]
MSSPLKNVALKYLETINDTPSKLPLQPSSKYNRSTSSEDLDKLAMQLNVNPVSTPTKTALLRTKFETPSVTVSSFKTPSNFSSSSNTSSRSASPIKRNRNYETPLSRKEIPDLKTSDSSSSRPYLSSPSNSTSKDSPGYEYLCRILSIKNWLQEILNEEIDKTPAELITDIRNGIILAKLANVILPTKRSVFTNPKLQFRHTENINRFFKLMDFLSVPDLFTFELTDLYDAKNVPKVWFCLHAMSYMLHKSNSSLPQIESMVGKVDFSPEDIRIANRSLVGTGLPNFSSADNDDNVSGESSYMNRAIATSPSKPSPIKLSPIKLNNEKPEFKTPEKSKPSDTDENIFYTPKEQIIERPSHWETDYKESKYYTPELDGLMTEIVKLQALSRGASFRYRMFVNKIMLRSYSDEITQFNSIIRGNAARLRTIHRHRDEILLFKYEIMDLQAVARSKLLRARAKYDLNKFEKSMTEFQSKLRGDSVRNRVKSIKFELLRHQESMIELQSQSKMLLIYNKTMIVLENKEEIEPAMVEFQSAIRRVLYERSKINNLISNLENSGGLIDLQSIIRGKKLREEYFTKLYVLSKQRKRLTLLQAVARGGVARTRLCNNVLITLMHEDLIMNELFAKMRGNLIRNKINTDKQLLEESEHQVIQVQSLFRGVLNRFQKDLIVEGLYEDIFEIMNLQSIIRGNKIRKELNSIDNYYIERLDHVIKAQSFIKRNFDQRAYKSLINMRNPPLSIIRRFAYLLSDNDMDYEQEMELSELKDQIIEKSKANEELETLIENLDIKLGLLDKNKISLEDFINNKFKNHKVIDEEVNNLNIEKLNKSSRERIEKYQSLFYLLQTKPVYFVRLHENIDFPLKETPEFKNLQSFIMLLFPIKDSSINFHSREEFFLLRLILSLMDSDIKNCKNMTDLTKSNMCFWIDYLLKLNNHTYQRLHLKSLLGKIVTMVIDDDELDFESDPKLIHNELINRDMKINGFSERDASCSAAMAIKDPEVSSKFVNNLMNLREFATETLNMLDAVVGKIPLHIRIIARKGYDLSKLNFPEKSETQHLSVAGVMFYKHYIASIFFNPENFGFLANDPFNPGIFRAKSKLNLKHLSRVIMQVFALKPFNDNFLKPLNEYLRNSSDIAQSIIHKLIDVNDIEQEYKLNDYDDIVTHERPKLTMKVSDMVEIEKIVQRNIDVLAPSFDDQLYVIANQLDNAINSTDDLVSLSELGMISLSLNPTTKEESIADTKGNALFTQVKRSVLYIIRVQEGDELVDLLISGIQPKHEEKFKQITTSEINESQSDKTRKKAYHKTSLGDLTTISYHELKKKALETILQLEFMGLVSRNDSYQQILNQIAVDIKTKHQQRVSRKSQLEIAIKTNQKLVEKSSVLQRQHKDYNAHIDSILSQLQSKPKDKKLFNIIPIFSKQYFYHRELKKSNRLPKFGSYKYSAKKLMEQKIVLDFGGPLNSRFSSSSKLDFMFSCHQPGKFTIEAANGSVNIPGAFSSISLDEILNLQYENKPKYEAFDGMVVFDSMNLTSFIFKKFYDLKKE